MVQRLQVQRNWVLMVQGSSQLSLPPAKFVSEHVKAGSNQDQRPQASQANEIEDAKIVEQEQDAHTNQNDRANRTLLAPGLERVGGNFSAIFGLGRLHSFEGRVENKTGEKNAKHGLETAIEIAG